MQVIHGFLATDSGWTFENLTRRSHRVLGEIVVADKGVDGFGLSPIFEATLLEKYLALNIFPYGKYLEGALFSPSDDSFMAYNETLEKWEIGSEPIYYPDTLLTEYIKKWYKPIQVSVKVPSTSYFYELKIGASILVSFNDYLLNYSLVQHLSNSIHFGFVSYPELSTPTQSCFHFPSLFDQQVENILVRKINDDYFFPNPLLNEGAVIVGEEANGPVMITFDYSPQVRYIPFGTYQIEKLPTIVVRQKEEIRIRKGYQREWMALDPTKRSPETTLESRLAMTYDLPIEVSFIAHNIAFAQMMYEQTLKATDRKAIKVKGTGDEIGLYWGTVIRRDVGTRVETTPVVDTLSTIVVEGELKNIFVSV
jgi:hypothetical protein